MDLMGPKPNPLKDQHSDAPQRGLHQHGNWLAAASRHSIPRHARTTKVSRHLELKETRAFFRCIVFVNLIRFDDDHVTCIPLHRSSDLTLALALQVGFHLSNGAVIDNLPCVVMVPLLVSAGIRL